MKKREQSINCTRELKLSYSDVYLNKNDISVISKQQKNEIDTKWWEEDIESFVEKDNLCVYAVYMKNGYRFNAALTEEELNKLTSD